MSKKPKIRSYSTDSFNGNVLCVPVKKCKIVTAIYNNSQKIVGVTYDDSDNPTQMYIDLGEAPTSNVIIITH